MLGLNYIAAAGSLAQLWKESGILSNRFCLLNLFFFSFFSFLGLLFLAVLVGRGPLTFLIQHTLRAGLGQSSGGFGQLGLKTSRMETPPLRAHVPGLCHPSGEVFLMPCLHQPGCNLCYTALTSREDWPHPPCTCLPKNHGLLLNPPEPLSFH